MTPEQRAVRDGLALELVTRCRGLSEPTALVWAADLLEVASPPLARRAVVEASREVEHLSLARLLEVARRVRRQVEPPGPALPSATAGAMPRSTRVRRQVCIDLALGRLPRDADFEAEVARRLGGAHVDA